MNKTLSAYAHTRAEIDLDALAFNLRQVRNLVGKEKKVLAVVKANAYGHGALGIARELETLGVDFLGVAFLEEGIHLRECGIQQPMLILGGIFPFHIEDVVRFNLTPAIYDIQLASLLDAEGKRQSKKIPVHVKIDTGMNRIGVPSEEAEVFFTRLRDFEHLEIEGVLSHFSSAHVRDKASRSFTDVQIERFKNILKRMHASNIRPPLLHMANSSAIMEGIMPELTMVRAGLMLYGAYPSRDLQSTIALTPVMTLKTRVIQIKSLPVSSPISYGRTFHTQRESRIAILAIGYGDGYHYRLSNKGKVLIRGREAPIVGAVCMDLAMIDTTDIPEAQVGDEAVLFGCQGEANISVEDVAALADTISYEILCGISSRVPRLYKKQGKCIET